MSTNIPLVPDHSTIYGDLKDGRDLCKSWTKGVCPLQRCLYRHFYMERDVVASTSRQLEPSPREKVVFTSPLYVKVYEEVLKTRKEEVDLETGRRRSFVEEKKFEVLDLTGERGSQRTPLRSLDRQLARSSAPHSPHTPHLHPTKYSELDQSVVCLSSPVPHLQPSKVSSPVPHLQPSKVSSPVPHLQPSKVSSPVPHLQPSKVSSPVHLQTTSYRPPPVAQAETTGARRQDSPRVPAETGASLARTYRAPLLR